MAKTVEGIARVFELFGLTPPTGDRLERILNDSRSITEIRDDLFDFAINRGGDTAEDMISTFVRNRFEEANLEIAAGGETAEERLARITSEIISGQRTLGEVSDTIRELGGGGEATADDGVVDNDPVDIAKPGVMPGGKLIRVGDEFYQAYEFPPGSGNFMVFQYDNRDQVIETFGDIPAYEERSLKWLNEHGIVQADANEVIGETVDFHRFTATLMQDAAMAAGIRDPSLIGRIASDPEMQQIMAQAIAGDYTPQQVLAEQRKTDFWKNVLYPGIERFYSMSDNPESDYREYMAAVEPALEALGYERGADGTYKNQIKRMLDNEIDASTFLGQVPTYIRATQNAEFAAVLDRWADQELGRNVDFNDWFDLLAGASVPELESIAEKAMLAYEAQTRGANISDDQIEQLAARTQLTQAQAVAALSGFNEAVLALGDEGLSRYGLSRDAVLSASAGITDAEGRSPDELRLLVAKTARELDLFDEEKINFYVGFDTQGRPVRPGLTALTPERA